MPSSPPCGSSNALPPAWIDQLFARLSVRYGSAWTRLWEGIPMEAVREDWAQELAGFVRHPEALAYGLENLPPDRPPTVRQFGALCNRAPDKPAPQLPAPKASADVVIKAVAGISRNFRDPMQWAHDLKERAEAGEIMTAAQRDMYRDALRMERERAEP